MFNESSCDISDPSNIDVVNSRSQSSNHCFPLDVLLTSELVKSVEVKPDTTFANGHQEDCYEHVEQGIYYSDVNIPGPGANLDDFNSQLAKGCDCTDGNCSTDRCRCVSRYGLNYSSGGVLTSDKISGAVIECNSECVCSVDVVTKSCGNRLVQLGPLTNLETFVTECKGYGLRCRYGVRKGTFICEYAGEVIGMDEARRRVSLNVSGMNYVFVLKEHVGDSKTIATCVDPGSIGNVGRYVNHSCRPNCAIIPVRVDSPVPRLAIFATSDIAAGVEITFDYAGGGAAVSDGTNKKRCHCNSDYCKTYLPFDNDLL